ncbi:MAG TPA: hypothetical protein VMT45_13775 [Thermoanaerobaculaceae bacterium]|nr:hypothetical protein [Thermoanaerobaculaceae bacterium]
MEESVAFRTTATDAAHPFPQTRPCEQPRGAQLCSIALAAAARLFNLGGFSMWLDETLG